MQKNFTKTNNNNHKPPRPPPLSVSLPPPQPDPPPQLLTRPGTTNESPHSPLRAQSQARSDKVVPPPAKSTALVEEKFYSPINSPLPITPPKEDPLPALPDNSSVGPPHLTINLNRREDVPPPNSSVVFRGEGGGERKAGRSRGVVGGGGSGSGVLGKVAVGVRVMEIVFCLISFSVMASDKTEGWSGDSFDRYKEYRFCLTVAVFGFVYSAFQAYNLGSHLATGKHVITHHLRYHFDFVMDQIIAYLLISASSAAASRVDDWQSNWGKDEFTEKASASISMAFLAFICFAMSSLISGYNLCNRDLY